MKCSIKNHVWKFLKSVAGICLIQTLIFSEHLYAQEFIDATKEAIEKLASTGQLLENCSSYSGLSAEGGCTEADSAGKGLNCPQTTTAEGGTNESCEVGIMSELRFYLGVDAKAKLEASALNTSKMRADIEPIASASHTHQTCSETSNACEERFLKRKDFVRFLFAIWNSASVSVGMTDLTFIASVEASEGFTHSFEALICGWKNHTETKECSHRE